MEQTEDVLTTVYRAKMLARKAHQDQVDLQGNPYFDHLERVASRFDSHAEYVHRTVAYLHDTLEDTDLTELDLIDAGFGQSVIEAVLTLTRRFEEPYEDYIDRVSLNHIARRVKLADLDDNLQRSESLEAVDKKKARYLRKRYEKARNKLLPSPD